MTLKEIGEEYERSCVTIRSRITALRALLTQTEDPEERFQLNRRINELIPILRETRELGKYCQKYYAWRRKSDDGQYPRQQQQQTLRYPVERMDRGHGCMEEADSGYQRRPDGPTEEKPDRSHPKRIDSASAASIVDVLFGWKKRDRDRRRPRRKHLDGITHADTSKGAPAACAAVHILKDLTKGDDGQ